MNIKKLSREEIAKIEIGHTVIRKTQIVILCSLFLGLITIYPIIQFVYEFHTRDIRRVTDFQPLTILPLLAEPRMDKDVGLPQRFFNFNRELAEAIKKYENTLEDTSALRATLLPIAQKLMIETLNTGNEKVILGKDGWLFYVSDFNYLINSGFLCPERLKKRALNSVQPDPVKAILDFQQQLKKRGIELFILPIPVKPMLYADKLGGEDRIIQNPSWAKFRKRIETAGLKLVDVTPELAKLRNTGIEPYLKTDTHWTPEGMAVVAKRLAGELGVKGAAASIEKVQITALGDIAQMLKLSHPEEVFQMEMVTIYPSNYRPQRNARILLLGDSFTNIYSQGAMNWGNRSGLAEQLMSELGEPIDLIVRNDAGAYATRQLLANELKRGRDRLIGKKVVIWEFAIRELADGDWKMLDMTLGEVPETRFLAPQKKITLNATVLAVSEVPRPNTAPYKDHIMTVHLGDINGGNDQAVVYMISMQNNVWTPAAQLRIGENVRFELAPWTDYEAEYGSWNRSELNDEELLLQEPCWGEVKK